MREIKFRAWNIQQKKFIEIAALDFHRVESACVQEVGTPPHFYHKTYPEDENILMQFTGIKDKNGREIYEGDVIKFQVFANWDDDGEFKRHVAKVIFHEGRFCWDIMKEGKNGGYYSAYKIDSLNKTNSTWGLEVIGNIYQNPELLK